METHTQILTNAIRYCFLASAGAMIALLAFLGQVWGSSPVDGLSIVDIRCSFAWFVAGVVLAIIALAIWVLCEQYKVSDRVVTWITVVIVGLSVWCFGMGTWQSANWLAEGVTSAHFPEGHLPQSQLPAGHIP